MAKNERIGQLRETAKRLERNATRKMSRLRHGRNPVELTGSKFDYRKGAKSIDTMRSRDLQSHIKRLQGFNNRTARFMPTAEGIAGPKEVNRYEKAKRAVNRKREKLAEKFGDRPVAGGVETYKERFAMREAAQRRMSDPAVNNPFRKIEDGGIKFATPEALLKMAKKFENESRPEFDRERTWKNKVTLAKILQVVDHPELSELVFGKLDPDDEYEYLVEPMTDEQFDLMWFDPDFMAGEGWLYAQAMGKINNKTMSEKQMAAFEDQVEIEKELAYGIAQHAAKQ